MRPFSTSGGCGACGASATASTKRLLVMIPGQVDAAPVDGEWAGGDPRRRPSEAECQCSADEQRRQARAPPRVAPGYRETPDGPRSSGAERRGDVQSLMALNAMGRAATTARGLGSLRAAPRTLLPQ